MRVMRVMTAVAMVMLSASAAIGQQVSVDYDKGRDFSAFKTFMWMKEPATVNPLDRQRLIAEVNAALGARGLTLVTADADLCVAAHTATQEERTLSTFYDGLGGWRWRGGGFGSSTTTVTTYDVGTLIVDIFDARMKEAIWRGVSMKTLSDDPAKNARNLNKAITKLFERWPAERTATR
jgi:hypothetical protein